MTLFSFLRRLYSLDTLDTRFTVSSTNPPRPLAADTTIDSAKPAPGEARDARAAGPQLSRWNTPEFYLYYVVILMVVPSMFYVVCYVSKASHPNYPKIEPLLSDGWIPGRKVDNSDGQYASFRNNIPHLFVLALVHPLLRQGYDYLCRADSYTKVRSNMIPNSHHVTQGLPAHVAADARLEQRISFDFGFALVFASALHGFSATKILLILYLGYRCTKALPKAYIPAATWIFNICILFSNEIFRGYPFARIAAFVHGGDGSGTWGAWLDRHGGMAPRWEVLFNITVLRSISFSMDYYWSLDVQGESAAEHELSNIAERDRVASPAKPADYSFRNYVAYALYAPLYNAGPIITFNDYVCQQRFCSPSIQRERNIRYAIRFLLALLAMEVIIHYIYAVAIFHAHPDWAAYTPYQLSMLGFFNLHHIWLKLLLPWRFFRLWALLDKIDPPENMVRCMSNNYSISGFWRGWHRSYNRWLIRYIFIPLGGSGRGRSMFSVILTYLAIFTFVALWHDIRLRLLMWGWLITFFVAPEVVASALFPKRKWANRPNAYRVLCGVGAVAQILFMMAANLVGFAVGLDGLEGLAKGIFGSASGMTFFALACGTLFVGVQVMFELREEEGRTGVYMKC